MYFERIYDEGLAEASYIIACQAKEAAVVVDPTRDIDLYLTRAAELGYEIVGVAETHIHADFLSGGRDLARATGATLYISGEQGEGWVYEGLDDLNVVTLGDEEDIELGNVKIRALHTPGHTPEHMSYLVVDGARSDEPVMLLSGDFVFVGDLGRPDLLEKAAGESGTAEIGAKQLFESLKSKFLTLPDHVQIFPNHGAGSACGKALGAVPSSTVGYERKTAWWAKYLEEDDYEGFVAELLDGQPESPKYFRQMKIKNRDGMEPFDALPTLPELTPRGVQAALQNEAIIVDVRPFKDFAAGHAKGAINLPFVKSLSTFAGWVLPYDRPLVVFGNEADLDEIRRRLFRVGFTKFAGYIPRLEGYVDVESAEVLEPQAAAAALKDGAKALDVRAANEFAEGHLEGAKHIHYGFLMDRRDELSKDEKYVVYCGTGARASVATSVLERCGYDVVNGGGLADITAAMKA